MKQISPQLFAFLTTREQYHRADLIQVELLNGTVIAATTAQEPVTFVYPGNSPPVATVYWPSKFGAWERGSIKTRVNFKPKSEDMKLTLTADQTVFGPVQAALPGSPAVLSATLTQFVQAGLFDAATVRVFTIYWDLDSTPNEGVKMGFLTTFVGRVSTVAKLSRTGAEFKVSDMLYLLNFPVPRGLIQTSCRHTLFDAGCALTQASFEFKTTVAASSNKFFINLTNNLTTASWWNSSMTVKQGKIKFTGGQNAGLEYGIKDQISNTQIQLFTPLKFPVGIGDTISIFPGCDKSVAACTNQFNNLIHIGAMPFVPNPEIAI